MMSLLKINEYLAFHHWLEVAPETPIRSVLFDSSSGLAGWIWTLGCSVGSDSYPVYSNSYFFFRFFSFLGLRARWERWGVSSPERTQLCLSTVTLNLNFVLLIFIMLLRYTAASEPALFLVRGLTRWSVVSSFRKKECAKNEIQSWMSCDSLLSVPRQQYFHFGSAVCLWFNSNCVYFATIRNR